MADFRKYFIGKPVKKVYLFGSYARGEASEDSDIDLLVDLDYSMIYNGLEFFEMWSDLEQISGKKVDLVSATSLSKYVKEYVENDKILIYEKAKTRRLRQTFAHQRRYRRNTKVH
ncbi:type VII toxin-antitoxin system MntA family adenylyltransferase antitoxin [Thermoflexibacter ruber]|uniref:type VII toxin-antitoxin system MntA family adenylyltransferase antitoxin n=1 Tax=Thermoflexibacter ruber TaxID=1003 RepID=UPI001FEA9662|nr:nucleotidyltransferase domain-containing protein [Thermoflexibacter ruber]